MPLFTNDVSSLQNANQNWEANGIKGIQGLEQDTDRWLREAFQIQSPEALVDLSVSQVLEKAKIQEKNVSEEQVYSWIEQARSCCSIAPPWQAQATFVLSLQTRLINREKQPQRIVAHFIEADRKEIWSGTEHDGVYEFIFEQLRQFYQIYRGEPITKIFHPKNEVETMNSRIDEIKGDSNSSDFDSGNFGEMPSLEAGHDISLDPNCQIVCTEAQHRTTSINGEQASSAIHQLSETTPVKGDFGLSTEDVAEQSTSITAENIPVQEITSASVQDADRKVRSRVEGLSKGNSEEPLRLEITQIKIYPPLKLADGFSQTGPEQSENNELEKVVFVDVRRRLLMGELPTCQLLDMDVVFQLKGSGAIELTRQPLIYSTEVAGENRMTHRKLIPGSVPVGTLTDGELAYTCRLTGVSLPEAGTYRLQVITQIKNAPVSPDVIELPFVQVA